MKGVLNANYCLYKKRITKVRERHGHQKRLRGVGKMTRFLWQQYRADGNTTVTEDYS